MMSILKRLFAKLNSGVTGVPVPVVPTSGNTTTNQEIDAQPRPAFEGDLTGNDSRVRDPVENDPNSPEMISTLVPFDENLLERARTQWQFGDWETLTAISREQLQHHPDRAKLALLVAAGHGQCGHADKLHQFVRLAADWGCSKRLISQVLVSGVQNSLGRAWLAGGREDRATLYFEESIRIGMPSVDIRLIAGARRQHQEQFLALSASKSDET